MWWWYQRWRWCYNGTKHSAPTLAPQVRSSTLPRSNKFRGNRGLFLLSTLHIVCIWNSIWYSANDNDNDLNVFGAELSFTRVFWRNWNAITWFPSPNRSSRDPRWPIICPARASWAKSERAPACSFPRTRLVPPSLHLLPFIIEFLCASGRSDINLVST